MPVAKIILKDQVNCKLEGLSPEIRRKITDACKYFVPYARHTPSFKLGRWDGNVGFCTVGGNTYINLLDRIIPIIIDGGYEIELDDRRPIVNFEFPEISEDMMAHKVWPEGHPMAGEPIVLRDYQAGAIETFTENLQSIECLATGAGKTLITACLSSIIEPYGRSIVIVPNRSLVEQTEEDYVNLGLDVGVFYGGRLEFGHTHTICTWQSLAIFAKKSAKEELPISFEEFLKGVVCVMVDEVHTAKADVLRDLLCGPMAEIPIRWGFTGTIPKEPHDKVTLLVTLGEVVGQVKAKELQDKGVLSNCDIEIIQLIDDHVDFDDYHAEHEYLMSDMTRLKWLAKFVDELSKKGNVLLLVDRIDAGNILEELMEDSVFVSGETKTSARRKEYKSFKEGGEKKLIATPGVAAVGISITHIDFVIYFSYGKSFTRSIQTIGRGLRKGGNKTHVKIIDICSTLKFDKRHLTVRKKFYTEEQYPFTMQKVDYRNG